VYRLVRPLLFLLPPEVAHRLATASLRAVRGSRAPSDKSLEQTVFGLRFPNPLGLAAGMDKGDVLAPAWFSMGFGWVEIGTVTPRPQPGNPPPRLFRLVPHRAVINRMGFNNRGAREVARRLERLATQPGPLCLNVGRNKSTPNERAADDYAEAARVLAPHADLVTINVSSPNTPGLRALQDELGALVSAVRAALPRPRPILVKLSPDEPDERLVEMANAAVAAGASGIVATNTTTERSAVQGHLRAAEQGGLSGAPLKDRAEQVCKLLYRSVQVPIVGVGGIFTAEDAYARIRAGATLVQLYTALIYDGPGTPRRIVRGLRDLLRRDGLTLQQAIGRDA
jgi:dihydroorotate dehydrogenase